MMVNIVLFRKLPEKGAVRSEILATARILKVKDRREISPNCFRKLKGILCSSRIAKTLGSDHSSTVLTERIERNKHLTEALKRPSGHLWYKMQIRRMLTIKTTRQSEY